MGNNNFIPSFTLEEEEIPSSFVPDSLDQGVDIQNNVTNIPSFNLPEEEIPSSFVPDISENTLNEQNSESTSSLDNDLARGLSKPIEAASQILPAVKNVAAAGIGSIPDLVGMVLNATGLPKEYLGGDIPSLTQELIQAVDKYGGPITEDKNKYITEISKFLGSLIGTGGYGAGIKAAGIAANAPKLEKAGKFIGKFGETVPSPTGVGASIGGGSAAAFSHENELPLGAELGLTLGGALAGGSAGSAAQKLGNLAVNKSLGSGKNIHKELLARDVSPEDIKNSIENAIKSKKTEFLSEKTLKEFPEEIREAIEKKKPFLLNQRDINVLVNNKDVQKDHLKYFNDLQKSNSFLTLGEQTESPSIISQERGLSQRPDSPEFQSALQQRRKDLSDVVQKLSHNLSSKNVDKESLGETIADQVKKVYKDADEIRTDSWNNVFGKVANEEIIGIPTFMNKLIEFSKLKPSLTVNEVAIKAANKLLAEFIPTVRGKKDMNLLEAIKDKITLSPKDINEKLVGLNRELERFPDKTFSRKQIGDLKNALDRDLDIAVENNSIDAGLVRLARSQYKENSKIIDDIDKSIIFSKINKKSLEVPEKVAQSLDKMEHSQLKLTIDALKRSDEYGEILPQIQKYYIERAFNAATGGNVSKFSINKFMKTLPDEKVLDTILGDSSAKKEITDIVRFMEKITSAEQIAPKEGGSQTTPLAQAQKIQEAKANEVSGLSLPEHIPHTTVGIASKAWSKFSGAWNQASLKKSNKEFTEILIDPSQRNEIFELIMGKSKPQKKKFSIGKKSLMPSINSTFNQKEKKKNKNKPKITVRPLKKNIGDYLK